MKALLLIDIQKDFLPTGALPVPEGDCVVAGANRLMQMFELVVATQDWHPAEHGSFAARHSGKGVGEMVDLHGLPQILWPTHCVEETEGAAFAPGLEVERITHVVQKGTDVRIDSYSGFFDNGQKKATELHAYLQGRGVREVYIAGLATDYCVKFTALDAVRLGYVTHVVTDACRGVNIKAGDVAAALKEMEAAGVKLVRSEDVEREMQGAIR